MERFFSANPGLSSRVAHHIRFEDYTRTELVAIAELMLARDDYRFSRGAEAAFAEYLDRRIEQPRFANARSVRNASGARAREAGKSAGRGAGHRRPRRAHGADRARHPRQPGVRRTGRRAASPARCRDGSAAQLSAYLGEGVIDRGLQRRVFGTAAAVQPDAPPDYAVRRVPMRGHHCRARCGD